MPRPPSDDEDDVAHARHERAAPTQESMPTEEELLELSGEESLNQIREVVLRDRGLRDIGALLAPLERLEVLSISNNCVLSLSGWPALPGLTVLNINFNRVSSLEPLAACTRLSKLYAASNNVGTIAPLTGCTELRSLSLFRNRIGSLDSTLDCLAALPHLEEVDLAANPCSIGPAYRHRLVAYLPALSHLDGDTLTDLDHELATNYLDEAERLEQLGEPVEREQPDGGTAAADAFGDATSRAPTRRAGVESRGGSMGAGGGADVLILDSDGAACGGGGYGGGGLADGVGILGRSGRSGREEGGGSSSDDEFGAGAGGVGGGGGGAAAAAMAAAAAADMDDDDGGLPVACNPGEVGWSAGCGGCGRGPANGGSSRPSTSSRPGTGARWAMHCSRGCSNLATPRPRHPNALASPILSSHTSQLARPSPSARPRSPRLAPVHHASPPPRPLVSHHALPPSPPRPPSLTTTPTLSHHHAHSRTSSQPSKADYRFAPPAEHARLSARSAAREQPPRSPPTVYWPLKAWHVDAAPGDGHAALDGVATW